MVKGGTFSLAFGVARTWVRKVIIIFLRTIRILSNFRIPFRAFSGNVPRFIEENARQHRDRTKFLLADVVPGVDLDVAYYFPSVTSNIRPP